MATQSRCQVEHCYGRLTEQGQDTVKVIYKLYERYVRHIARSTRHLTPEELEEVAQEVFLAVGFAVAHGNFPTERKPLFKWLKTTTQRQAARFVQKRNAHGVTQLNANTRYTFASEEELDTIHNGGEEFCLETLDEKHNTQVAFLPQAVAQLPYRPTVADAARKVRDRRCSWRS